MMNTVFKKLIGKNMEVYVDDMIVKSVIAEIHLQDLKRCFDTLDRYKIKLNPQK